MKVLGQNYFSMNSVLETVSKSISSLKSNCTCKILFKIIPFSDQVNRRKKLATSRGLKRYTHEQYGLEIIWMQQKKCITQFIIYYPSQPFEPRFFTLVAYQPQEVAGELFETKIIASLLRRLRVCFSNRFRPEIRKMPILYK